MSHFSYRSDDSNVADASDVGIDAGIDDAIDDLMDVVVMLILIAVAIDAAFFTGICKTQKADSQASQPSSRMISAALL